MQPVQTPPNLFRNTIFPPVFQIEMTYRAVAAGMSVVEVPIVFRDRVAGRSKMSSHIVVEAFTRVTWWGLYDLFTLRRRHRAYGE